MVRGELQRLLSGGAFRILRLCLRIEFPVLLTDIMILRWKVRPLCWTAHHFHRLLIGVPAITNFCTTVNGCLTLSRSSGSFRVIDILERWTDKQKGLGRSTDVHSFGILKLITRWWENWFFFFLSGFPNSVSSRGIHNEHLTLIWKKLMNSKGMCPGASAAPCTFVLSGKCAWFS